MSGTSDATDVRLDPAIAARVAPGEASCSDLEDGLSRLAARIERWCGGHTEKRFVLGGV